MMAVMEESKIADLMFLGRLGGEFIKGEEINDYIVPIFVQEWWKNKRSKLELVKDTLSSKFIRTDKVDVEAIIDFFQNEEYFKNDYLENNFYLISYLTARVHDAQDINIYQT